MREDLRGSFCLFQGVLECLPGRQWLLEREEVVAQECVTSYSNRQAKQAFAGELNMRFSVAVCGLYEAGYL